MCTVLTVQCLVLQSRRRCRFRLSLTLSTKWRGGYIWPPSLTYFCLELFDWFVLEAVGNVIPSLGNFWECPIFCSTRDISEKHLFYPTTTYSRLCSSEHTCMKILILAGLLTPGMIYSENNLGSIGHLQKLCNLFSQTLIYLKGAMLIYRLMPP